MTQPPTPNEPPARDDPPQAETEAAPPAAAETPAPSEPRTRIIRRAPTGPLPTVPDAQTTQLPPADPATRIIRRATLPPSQAALIAPSPRTAVVACVISIVSGWATSVVATELIAGWWRTDRLFCIAVGFLALVFAASTITGVIMLLLRRPIGRYLLVAGAVVAVLTYVGVFIAGARVAWIVHTLPVLPIASVVFALHPQTERWLRY
ncbi:hypothetical protein [Mycobacterium bourgelatii]|uniref:Uncharacterized protein n=1 Tax=Mycobacterium bourgelatii TaxID=1273442 RepID=A0A7I9YVK4_MYCBU|nr:hypothetical protein [Mycobacterium bourgelatii]GFG92622.1 hypothetical protein MBOU_46640 [Mycobacterium bourgelatii]